MIPLICPTPIATRDNILLGHGSGGKLSAELLREVFLPAFANTELLRLEDQALHGDRRHASAVSERGVHSVAMADLR